MPAAKGPTGTPTAPPKKPGPPRPDPDRLAALSSTINSNLILLSSAEAGPECETARVKAAAAAQELTNALRAPPEAVMNWFVTASIVSVVRLFQHWGVFDALPMPTPGLPPSEQGLPVPTLAAMVEAEESILLRLAYMLTSSSVLHLVPASGPSTPARLAHTPTSIALRSGQPMGAMFRLMFTNVVSTSTILPSYFDTYSRREPLGPSHIPTSFLAGHPELDYFSHLNRDPAATSDFMLAMAIAHRNAPTTGMYDMAPILAAAAAEPSRPVWIDVGGGDGHTVAIFRRAFPALPGSQCIIQDLPEVCTQASQKADAAADPDLDGVRWEPMDFHADPPVAGGRAYYLRHVLRDYSDATAVRILRNVARGLTRPDARILVAEQVSREPPAQYAAFKDFTMLAIGGKDRTLEGFERVAAGAGLEVERVWWDKGTPHAVVEMRLAGGEGN
ncbi:S-adenosyl-L-methionine-dependent methyltransferase [Podospora conica]|nr:S-adenosyl-L-methionine-dependent methyltransferase [Schizothecium conicum]